MFSNKFDVGIAYVFKVRIIKFNFKFLLIMSNIFFPNFLFECFGKCFVVYIFPWICIIFSIFFPTKIAKLRKLFKPKISPNLLIQLFKSKISPNSIVFPFTKETNVKMYFDIIKKQMLLLVFQFFVINHWC